MEIQSLHQHFLASTSICTDTRKIIQGCMFVALKGDNFDANTFAAKALEMGAKYVVIDNEEYKFGNETILVNDSLIALQQLANFHRRYLGLPVIALTGSNGKTTTKELINVVLSKKYNVVATVGNLNNHIGVPLTLLSFTKETEIGIVEMGANHQKEIELLCEIAEPNFGYITNFGKAHLEGFGGVEGVIKGKSELYDYLAKNTKTAFINLDDPIQEEKTAALPRYTFATDNYNCDVRVESVEANPMVTVKVNDVTIQSNLIGIYNAPNISAAVTIGSYFKVSDAKIKDAIQNYIPANNRSQLMEKNGRKIILDAYNANPSSMTAAIANFAQIDGISKLAVLGDMFELGVESLEEHKNIVDLVNDQDKIDVIFVGHDFYANRTENPNLQFFQSYDSFRESYKEFDKVYDTLLIKGSRGMALERTLDMI
ncbi:MAG: UDP-N-acetylmuramoyl-tripeptide--D-alanyl-D-alanine ligase [Pedobacter sp.]|nr:MAG: UDP-N-acetylmuramoyl-tripeptide--D-alanyl-D-alanine ligase [Pedobacter sp.]